MLLDVEGPRAGLIVMDCRMCGLPTVAHVRRIGVREDFAVLTRDKWTCPNGHDDSFYFVRDLMA